MTLALLLGAAIVSALPAAADAKVRRHHYRPVVQTNSGSDGSRFVAAALHQLVVPLEVTFAPPAPPPRRYYRRHRHYR
jgi:hypothetical protein